MNRLIETETLLERQARLAAFLEEAPEALFMKDMAGRYVYVNRAAARFLGRSPEEVLGKDDSELFSAETAEAIREADLRILASGETVRLPEVGTAGGRTRTYLSLKGVFRNADGEITGLFGISRDLTAWEEMERQVTRLVAEAETPQEAALMLCPLDLGLSAALMARRREVQEARAL